MNLLNVLFIQKKMIHQILMTYEKHFIIILKNLNSNNDAQKKKKKKKDVEKKRVVINTTSKLYNKLLKRYATE